MNCGIFRRNTSRVSLRGVLNLRVHQKLLVTRNPLKRNTRNGET
jgi:hypothetical protein